MKKKTLIGLFLTSSIFLLLIAGCNENTTTVASTSEINSEVIEAEGTLASAEDEALDVSSEVVKDGDTSKETKEKVSENKKNEKSENDGTKSDDPETALVEVVSAGKNGKDTDKATNKNKVQYVSGMPSADLEKYNNYKASTEPVSGTTNETVDPATTPKQNGNGQKKETTKQKVVKEEVTPTVIEVVNPNTEATVDNISQEMANLLNAKRKELGFPQTVEVIPESDVATHNAMKQATINLGVIEFSHNPTVDGTGLKLAGTVIGKSGKKDSATMFNSWMNSPGHYKTIIPNDEFHIYPEDVMQVVCYVYGPYDGNYYYNLTYRFKPKEEKREEWQEPYVNTTPSEPTPGVADDPNEQPGSTVYVEGQTGYIDNYIDEDILNRLAGTDDFMPFFNSCSPELQEHYRAEHPELFN